MKARVLSSYRFLTVSAFAGHEYVKGDWRDVPKSSEGDARNHPLLEVLEDKEEKVVKAAPAVEEKSKTPEPEPEPKAPQPAGEKVMK